MEAPGFTLLTYNVHSCIGTDRKLDTARIADVIAESGADIVLLQELDVGRVRTGGFDQAMAIANHLDMASHFHPALHLKEEKYGDAILTALPCRLLRAGPLPSVGEPRGALKIEVSVGGRKVHVVNTHLGLRRGERMAQAAELLGEGWLAAPESAGVPAILGGDFNAVPSSAVFRHLAGRLHTEESAKRLSPTFPSRFPFLRLDHLFFTPDLELLDIGVIATPLARCASDHLPLLGTFRLRDALVTG